MKHITSIMLFLSLLQTANSQDTPLISAVKNNHFDVVQQLILQKVELNQADENGATPLMWAAYKSNLAMVQYLVEQGADTKRKGVIKHEEVDGYFGSLLNIAAYKGDLHMVKYFIEECGISPTDRGYNPKEQKETGWTAFEFAALLYKRNVLEYLVQYESPLIVMVKGYSIATEENGQVPPIFAYLQQHPNHINVTDQLGMSALHYACKSGNLPVIKLLVDNKVNINLPNKKGRTPLHLACENRQIETVRYLIEQGSDINAKDVLEASPLLLAAKSDHLEIVKILYWLNADLGNSLREAKGRSKFFLHHPYQDYFVILDLGLEKKVLEAVNNEEINITLMDTSNNTLLHQAATYGYLKLAKLLIDRGVNINQQNKQGDTPLIRAVYKNQKALVNLLLENQANVHLVDKDGFTALHIAVKWSDIKIIEQLIAFGANVNQKMQKYAVTPILRAAYTNRPEIIEFLLENGANINQVSNEKVSALHASIGGYYEKVQNLTKELLSPMQWVERKHELDNKHLEAVKLLLQHKVPLKVKMLEGRKTALELSKEIGLEEVSHLIEAATKVTIGKKQSDSSKDENPIPKQAKVMLPTGHEGSIMGIDISADGRFVLSGGDDNRLIIWDMRTGIELHKHTFANAVSAVAFSPDRKHFATSTGNLSDNIQLWDYSADTPQIIRTFRGHPHIVSALIFSPDGTRLYSSSWDSTIKVWDAMSGKLLQSLKSDQKEIQSLARTKDGRYLAAGALDHSITTWDIHQAKLLKTLKSHKTQVHGIAFSPDGNRLTSTDLNGKIIEWDWREGTEQFIYQHQRNVSTVAYSGDGKYLAFDEVLLDADTKQEIRKSHRHLMNINAMAFSPDNQLVLTAGSSAGNTIKIWSVLSGDLVQELKGHTDIHTAIPISDHEVLSMTLVSRYPNKGRIQKWNLAQGTMDLVDETPPEQTFDAWAISNDKQLIALAKNSFEITDAGAVKTDYFIEVKAINQLESTIDTFRDHNGLIKALAFSPDGKYLISGGEPVSPDWTENIDPLDWNSTGEVWDSFQDQMNNTNSDILLWEIESGEIVKRFKGHTSAVNQLSFSLDGKYLVSTSMNKTTKVWEVSSGQEIKSLVGSIAVTFIQNDRKIATKGYYKDMLIWDVKKNISTEVNLNSDSYPVAFGWSEGSQQLLVGMASGELLLWDASENKVVQKFKGHTNQIASINYITNIQHWLTTSQDRTMKLWKVENPLPIATYIAIDRADYLTYTPDNYYTASKNAARKIKFSKERNAYFFEQFDWKYNRPDIIMEQIGLEGEQLIQPYRAAYHRRMRRENIDTTVDEKALIVPAVSIQNINDLSKISPKQTLELHLKADGKKSLLRKIVILVNEVPAHGIDLDGAPDFEKKLTIKLSKGKNKISVYCINNQGVKSLREYFETYCEDNNTLPDLYILAIGVSEYKDQSANLKYPAKDVQDIIRLYKDRKDFYRKIHTKLLVDHQANTTKIKNAKAWLLNSKVDDKVIVFYAGHGTRDKQNELFFGTHETDFDNPNQDGLSYFDLEYLLKGIPARQKLLLIDACYAGEIGDKTPMNKINPKTEEEFKGRGLWREHTVTDPLKKSTFDLMKTLFIDFKDNTGTIVIGGASGTQLAYENDHWENGAFTYCFIKGLKENKADLNGDDIIMLSELHEYLLVEVPKLTGGLQRPMMRKEFIGNDWQVW